MKTYSARKDSRQAPWLLALIAVSLCPFSTHAFGEEPQRDHELRNIKHIVVIYQENWSFDSLYGLFPGANGLSQSSPASLPVRQTNQRANRAAFQPGIWIIDADHAAATDQRREDRYTLYVGS